MPEIKTTVLITPPEGYKVKVVMYDRHGDRTYEHIIYSYAPMELSMPRGGRFEMVEVFAPGEVPRVRCAKCFAVMRMDAASCPECGNIAMVTPVKPQEKPSAPDNG